MAEATFPLIAPGSVASPAPESTELTKVEDHKGDGLSQLITEYKSKPRINELLCVFLTQVQELEDALWQLLLERALAVAVGEQLDVIGRIVGQDRDGLGDDDYRAVLRGRALANNSSGLMEQLFGVVVAALDNPPVPVVRGRDYTPGLVILELQIPMTIDSEIVNRLLQDAKSAGVRLIFTFPIDDFDQSFGFSHSADFPVQEAARGFDSAATPATGSGAFGRALD